MMRVPTRAACVWHDRHLAGFRLAHPRAVFADGAQKALKAEWAISQFDAYYPETGEVEQRIERSGDSHGDLYEVVGRIPIALYDVGGQEVVALETEIQGIRRRSCILYAAETARFYRAQAVRRPNSATRCISEAEKWEAKFSRLCAEEQAAPV